MTHPPRTECLIGLIGPACIGKTAVAAALANSGAAAMFRLRVFARDRVRAGLLPAQLATGTPPGDFGEETVDCLLRAAFLHEGLPRVGTPVVLDGFPTTADDLRLLNSVAVPGRPLAVVELTASGLSLMTRRHLRRPCLTCEPDLDGGPHEPAAPDVGLPDHCDTCGRHLSTRRRDEPTVFLDRLETYQSRLDDIAQTATALHVPWTCVDASGPLPDCVNLVAAAITHGGTDSPLS
jgi:adenylate kinase family enzyme